MECQWPAPAKLNLFLYITGRRSDGYHLLQTLFQFLEYGDTLTITPTVGDNIRLLNKISGITEQDNLIMRAAKLLQHHCRLLNNPAILGADIQLIKKIPIGGGLGGGSSDAATVLIALNAQWRCGLDMPTLTKLGLTLGADVPVFIYGKSALAEGIGELLKPVMPMEKWYLVTVPSIRISTKRIFNDPILKRDTPKRSLTQLMGTSFYNDCEPLVRKYFPVIEQHVLWLLKYAPTRMTGTGACIFAEFDTEIDARQVLSKIPVWMSGFVAKGTNISPLHRALLK